MHTVPVKNGKIMKITMVVEGLIQENELSVINDSCKFIAEKLRRDVEIDYVMATPYKVKVPRPMGSVLDLDDDIDGLICAAFEPDACCDEDLSYPISLGNQLDKQKNKK